MWFPMFSCLKFDFGIHATSVHAWFPSRWQLPRSPPVCRMKCDRRNARLWNVGERRVRKVIKVRRQVPRHWLRNTASEIFWRQHHQRKRKMKEMEHRQNDQNGMQRKLMLMLINQRLKRHAKLMARLRSQRRRRRQRQRHPQAKKEHPHHRNLTINMFISSNAELGKGRPGIMRFERTRSMVAAHAGSSTTDVKHANGQGSRAGLRQMSVQRWRLLRRFKIRVPQLLLRRRCQGNVRSVQGMWIERLTFLGWCATRSLSLEIETFLVFS